MYDVFNEIGLDTAKMLVFKTVKTSCFVISPMFLTVLSIEMSLIAVSIPIFIK